MGGVRHRRVRARHVDKPWGHEKIWVETRRYVGKILHVRRGRRLSLQYHREKDESIRVLRGLLELEIGLLGGRRRRVRLAPGDAWHIPPRTVHRMTALADTDILEVSTPELADVVRLEDDFGRIARRKHA